MAEWKRCVKVLEEQNNNCSAATETWRLISKNTEDCRCLAQQVKSGVGELSDKQTHPPAQVHYILLPARTAEQRC